MSRLQDACPFEPRGRTEHCESCCDVSDGLSPRVVAWLRPGLLAQVKTRAHGAKVSPEGIEHRRAAYAATQLAPPFDR